MSRFRWLDRVKERRRAPRIRVNRLEAVYWTGGPVTPRRVPEISLSGACIEMPDEWHTDTMIRMTLRYMSRDGPDSEPEASTAIWARVVRKADKGVCVEFVYYEASEIEDLRRLLAIMERSHESEPENLPEAIL